MINNRIVNNNNGATPTHPSAPGLVGTGMTIAGGRNDLVVGNTFSGNKAWGILLVPYPGVEESPPPQVPPEDNCKGGTKVESTCLYEPYANEIEGNTFANNGGYGNPSNGDIGEVADANPTVSPTAGTATSRKAAANRPANRNSSRPRMARARIPTRAANRPAACSRRRRPATRSCSPNARRRPARNTRASRTKSK